MKKLTTKFSLFILLAALSLNLYGQDSDALFSRLQGIVSQGMFFFDVDGINITAAIFENEFSTENKERRFAEYIERFPDLGIARTGFSSDSSLGFENYYTFHSFIDVTGLSSNTAYHFVADADGRLVEITFGYINKRDRDFERHFVYLFRNSLIPDSILIRNTTMVSSFNFAGRTISLPLQYMGRWRRVNSLQTFADGQMDWSVHKTLEDAQETISHRFLITSHQEDTELISDTTVDVIFEGVETTARKMEFRFTGMMGAMLRNAGGSDILNIYHVVAPVRGNYVSVIMSFYPSDQINQASGLPFLLEQVMELR